MWYFFACYFFAKGYPMAIPFTIQQTITIINEMFPCISTRVPTIGRVIVEIKCLVKIARAHDLDVKPPNVDEANVDTFSSVGSPN
jgi:hypothetical protein